MYLINHFLDKTVSGLLVPAIEKANVTNGVSGVGSLGQEADTCVAQYGRAPNFMLVDVGLTLYHVKTLRSYYSSSMNTVAVPSFKWPLI